ncbi:MAG: PIG-L family deacetylase, partial [Holosporales bacterium]|nr:PIG-L family deacetylase [Holosporales bacterium]
GEKFFGTKPKNKTTSVFLLPLLTQNHFLSPPPPPPQLSRRREQKRLMENIKQAYGFDKVFQLGYPTTFMDAFPLSEIISKIADIFRQLTPEIVYIPNRSDIHSDHRITFDAAFACTKSFRYPYVKKVLIYETISETEFSPAIMNNAFVPNYFVDITRLFKQKMDIIKNCYSLELGSPPFPRSLENLESLATLRGSTVGVRYAEAFQLLKWIV